MEYRYEIPNCLSIRSSRKYSYTIPSKYHKNTTKKGEQNLKEKQPIEVHVLAKGLAFPIAIFIYQGEEKVTLQYLLNNKKLTSFTSYDICV